MTIISSKLMMTTMDIKFYLKCVESNDAELCLMPTKFGPPLAVCTQHCAANHLNDLAQILCWPHLPTYVPIGNTRTFIMRYCIARRRVLSSVGVDAFSTSYFSRCFWYPNNKQMCSVERRAGYLSFQRSKMSNNSLRMHPAINYSS